MTTPETSGSSLTPDATADATQPADGVPAAPVILPSTTSLPCCRRSGGC